MGRALTLPNPEESVVGVRLANTEWTAGIAWRLMSRGTACAAVSGKEARIETQHCDEKKTMLSWNANGEIRLPAHPALISLNHGPPNESSSDAGSVPV